MNGGNKIRNCAYLLRIISGYPPCEFTAYALLHSRATALDERIAKLKDHNEYTLAGFFL